MSGREHEPGAAARGASGEDAQEGEMRAVLTAAYPAREPSEALRRRVAELAAQHDAHGAGRAGRGRWRWPSARLALGIAAAMVLAFVMVTLVPTWTAAQVLRRAEAAMEGVRNAHVITWRVALDGSRQRVIDSWYQGGLYRFEDRRQGRIEVFAGGKLWTYEPKLNKVTVRRRDNPFAYAPSGFSLKAMARDFARWGWRDKIRVLSATTVHGRAARSVVIERAVEPVRILVTVDAATDLPIESAVQSRLGGQWITNTKNEHRFDERLPEGLFAPTFPKSATVFDADEGKAIWERRLARGSARRHVGDREIVIRDLQVNAEGDVFLLYTAGKHPGDRWQDWSLELSDNLGTEYVARSSFQPYIAGRLPAGPGYVFHGEKLEGAWWVPAQPQRPWRRRRFQLAFHVQPVTHHGKEHPTRQIYSASTSFTFLIDRPASHLAPEYMAVMPLGLAEYDIYRDRALARARYYRRQKPNLPRAVAFYREVLRLRDERAREIGVSIVDPSTWFDLGSTLHRMGHLEEARAAYEQAVQDAIYWGYPRNEAREALEVLKAGLALQRGSRPPAFSAMDLDGRKQSPADYRGQVLIIDFWQPWGKGWLTERRRLEALYEKYHDSGLAILSVSMSLDRDQLQKIVREHQLAWPQVLDGLSRENRFQSQTARLYGYLRSITPLPHCVLVDRQGLIRATGLRGADLERAVVEVMTEAR